MRNGIPEADGATSLLLARDGKRTPLQDALDRLPRMATILRDIYGGASPVNMDGTRRIRVTVERTSDRGMAWLLARDAGPYSTMDEPPC